MRWGVSFSIPATDKADMLAIPPPSLIEEYQSWDGTKRLHIVYHFEYSPQSRQEWQRIASIKVQLGMRFKGIKFNEYDTLEGIDRAYTISELGKHFKERITFPKPFIDGTAYRILCRHSRKLYYEHRLHFEQLVAVSLLISTLDDTIGIDGKKRSRRPNKEGLSQCMKRAASSYKFAMDHLSEWDKKLEGEDLKKARSAAGVKSGEVRRSNSMENRKQAKELRKQRKTYAEIAKVLKVSLITVKRWCKKYH